MPLVQRQREIRKRRNRAVKVKFLKERLTRERDSKVRTRLITKLKKISPRSPMPEK